MAILNTGKSFASGEQLTADKLNLMISGSTFNVGGAVDNATLTVNSGGALAVNQITSSNIANNAITTSDLAQLGNNQFLGRTTSGTGDVESVDISAIATLLRPAYTVSTGGTAQTAGSQGNFTGVPAELNRILGSDTGGGPTGNTDFVYQMADFTGTASDFDYRKITGIIVRCNVQSEGNDMGINVQNSSAFGTRFLLFNHHNNSGAYNNKVANMTIVPVNAGETTFTLRHVRNDVTETQHAIVGFEYLPNLPTT